jgi:hypothetical protein
LQLNFGELSSGSVIDIEYLYFFSSEKEAEKWIEENSYIVEEINTTSVDSNLVFEDDE